MKNSVEREIALNFLSNLTWCYSHVIMLFLKSSHDRTQIGTRTPFNKILSQGPLSDFSFLDVLVQDVYGCNYSDNKGFPLFAGMPFNTFKNPWGSQDPTLRTTVL